MKKRALLIIVTFMISCLKIEIILAANITVDDILNKLQQNIISMNDLKAEVSIITSIDTKEVSLEKMRFFFKPILNQVACILAQSDDDANRFIALGASPRIVSVCGNIKFDLQTQVPDNQTYRQLKQCWGEQRPVLIAASTHDDEERQLLMCLATLTEAIPDLLLLIAPRHPERFRTVYQMSKEQGVNTARRSEPETIDANTEVIVIDSLGELLGFYQLCDFAFVGGSLVPVGGHNVLEPIAMKIPVFTGPHIQNSKSVCRDLCAAGAMQVVDDIDALVVALKTMHEDKSHRQHQVANANAILTANQGSLARHMEKIEALISVI